MTTAGKEFNLDHLTVADKRQVEENRSGAVPDGGTLSWAITLFGTAVGAGILFLPIDAGSCLLYTSPSPRDRQKSRMPSSA